MKTYQINKEEDGLSLEKFVRKTLPNAPTSFIYKLFRKKDAKVNGHWKKEKTIIMSTHILQEVDSQVQRHGMLFLYTLQMIKLMIFKAKKRSLLMTKLKTGLFMKMIMF